MGWMLIAVLALLFVGTAVLSALVAVGNGVYVVVLLLDRRTRRTGFVVLACGIIGATAALPVGSVAQRTFWGAFKIDSTAWRCAGWAIMGFAWSSYAAVMGTALVARLNKPRGTATAFPPPAGPPSAPVA